MRFSVEEGALAVLGNPFTTVGQIIDISMGGLAFRYTARKKVPREPTRLDIVSPEGLCFLEGFLCETIYDFETDDTMPFTSLVQRRRGLRFDNLTPGQRSQLRHFIREYTIWK